LSRWLKLGLVGILVHSAPRWFFWLLLNLFLLGHLLLGLSLIRNRIGSLSIFAGSGTATLHCGTATVCAGCSIPILSFLSNCTHSYIYNLSSICLGSFCMSESMLD
jgi:hypothetical protein